EQIADPLAASACLELQLLKIVAAPRHAQLGERLLRRGLGREADHAARRVAVQRRARPADHLDLTRRAEIDAVDRALAVRQRLGDAVDENLHAANAEVRACAEAADRHAQVLREVVADNAYKGPYVS